MLAAGSPPPRVEITNPKHSDMGHMQRFEAELRTRVAAIAPGAEADELVAWLKAQVLQSYHNGLAACGQPAAGRRGAGLKPGEHEGRG